MEGNPVEHVKVPMTKAGVSHGSIESDGFGPCLFFLMDFLFNDEPMCFLMHFSYEFDDSGISLFGLLEDFSHKISLKLKKCLNIRTILPDPQKDTKTSDFILIVGGGDIEESVRVKEAFSLLNSNQNHEIMKSFLSQDVSYLYENLLLRTVILRSITKGMDEVEEHAAG